MDLKKIEFVAYLSPIAAAISISGTGEGAVLRLEIPPSELYSIVQLQLLAGKIFRVTIDEIEEFKYGKPKTKTNSTKNIRGKSREKASPKE